MKRIPKIPLLGLWLLLVTLVGVSCNSTTIPEEKTPYRQENDAFFKSFAQKSGYQELLFANETYPIYYKVLKQAEGNTNTKPLQNSNVQVRYSVKLMSGVEVEADNGAIKTLSIYDPNGSSIIKGLQIALMHMNVGDKWEVIIPWQLGYGRYSQGYSIPAYSTLIFEIELVGISKL